MTSTAQRPPISVAVLTDYELVAHGFPAMLSDFADRVTVVDVTVDARNGESVDIVLCKDHIAGPTGRQDWSEMVGQGWDPGYVVRYSWDHPTRDTGATRRKPAGNTIRVPMWLSGAALVDAIEEIWTHGTYTVSDDDVGGRNHDNLVEGTPGSGRRWPGQAEGLTEREAQIVSLIVAGLTNKEIATQVFLGINTVKTYIRSAYRTMGVTTRSSAVLWGIDHGLRPKCPQH